MKKELKAKWLNALRSGDYKQTRATLHEPKSNGFCCLGVLCDVSEEGTWNLSGYSIQGQQARGKLSPKACELFGITASQEFALIAMNDGGKSFEEIASYIENSIS